MKNLEFPFLRRILLLPNNSKILVIILMIYISLWFMYPKPFHASDPWVYSLHAYNISTGSFFNHIPDNIFAHRLGVTLPTAAIYKVFGVNSISSNLWPLILSCISIVIVWMASPKDNSRFFAALLFATSVVQFNQSTTLMPDLIVSTFMISSSMSLYKREELIRIPSFVILFPLLAAIALFFAFITKLSMYWVLLIWFLVFCYDLVNKRWELIKFFYLPVFFFLFVFGTGYLIISNELWGSPLARFDAVQRLTGQHLWAWNKSTALGLIKRLTYEPVVTLVLQYNPVFVLSIGGVFLSFNKNKFWVFQYLIYLFLWWFGSSSFTSYEPLPLSSPRMLLPALPVMSILGGTFLSIIFRSLFDDKPEGLIKQFRYIPFLLTIILINSIIGNLSYINTVLLSVAIIGIPLISIKWSVFQKSYYNIFFILVLGLICLPLYIAIRDSNFALADRIAEDSAMKEVVKELQETQGTVLMLCLDKRSPKSLAYYWSYEYPEHLIVGYYGDYALSDWTKYDKVLVFYNSYRSIFLKDAYGDPFIDPEFLSSLSGYFLLNQNGVQLFEVSSIR